MTKRIFFDISGLVAHLASRNNYTGIQRVVAMVIQAAASSRDGVFLSYWSTREKSYLCTEVTPDMCRDISDPILMKQIIYCSNISNIPVPLAKYATRPFKLRYHKLRLDLASLARWEKPFKRYGIHSRQWRELPQNPTPRSPKFTPFFSVAQAGDRLVILDASWVQPASFDAFKEAQRSGLFVATMIHDLIPIRHPRLVPRDSDSYFREFLRQSLEFSSMYLTNSEATRVDVLEYLGELGRQMEVKAVPLARQANIQKSNDAPEALSQHVHSIPHIPYALFVGTLETRKNLWRLAQAWDLLRRLAPGAAPRLVLAGGSGWHNHPFDEFFDNSGGLGGWISVVDRPNEAELDYLYRHCQFCVQVSLAEGWGLPVGEALSYGKTCVVSASGALREVGGDLVEYCDQESVESISQACAKLIGPSPRRRELEDRIAQTQLRTWNEVAHDLITAIN